MWLLEICGLGKTELDAARLASDEQRAGFIQSLSMQAELMLGCGVALTVQEWRDLDVYERAAFASARIRMSSPAGPRSPEAAASSPQPVPQIMKAGTTAEEDAKLLEALSASRPRAEAAPDGG